VASQEGISSLELFILIARQILQRSEELRDWLFLKKDPTPLS
jgi:hypothetical protein